jgi:hypothetical protein
MYDEQQTFMNRGFYRGTQQGKPPTLFSLINYSFTKLFSSYNLMERLSPSFFIYE